MKRETEFNATLQAHPWHVKSESLWFHAIVQRAVQHAWPTFAEMAKTHSFAVTGRGRVSVPAVLPVSRAASPAPRRRDASRGCQALASAHWRGIAGFRRVALSPMNDGVDITLGIGARRRASKVTRQSSDNFW